MQKKLFYCFLVICLFLTINAYSENSAVSNNLPQEAPKFQHLISFLPLPFVTSFAINQIGIPIRYELGLPGGRWGIGIYNGILMKLMDTGIAFCDEIRFGPRFMIFGKDMSGMFVRLNAIIGFGSIAYDPVTKLDTAITPTFMYGAEANIGYTLIVDIGFMVEGSVGYSYVQQSLNGTDLPGAWLPFVGVQVGWCF